MNSDNLPDVSIVVISHNHGHFLEACLNSIYAKTKGCRFETILIDNRSDDNGSHLVKTKFPQVKLIENERRYGFAANNNIGIRASSGRYILMLNPDTELRNDAVTLLYDFLIKRPEIGICGAKLFFPDETIQHSCRNFPTLWSTILRRTPLRAFIPEDNRGNKHLMNDWDHNTTRAVDWMLGACLMFSRESIEKVGMLDERFPLYCEDIDLCLRYNKMGKSSFYVHEAEIFHYHQRVSDRKYFSKRTWIHYQSMLYFVLKHRYFLPLFK